VTGWGLGGATRGAVARARRLTLGSLAIDNVIVDMSLQKQGALAHAAPAGNIGSGVLKRFTVTFDYGNQLILLEPSPRTGVGDSSDRSGIWINVAPDGFRVDGIVAGSPAAQAGLQTGDVLIAVDGHPAQSMLLPALRDRLRDSAPGAILRIVVRSG